MTVEQYINELNNFDYNNLYNTYLLANTLSIIKDKKPLNEMEFYFDYILSLSKVIKTLKFVLYMTNFMSGLILSAIRNGK